MIAVLAQVRDVEQMLDHAVIVYPCLQLGGSLWQLDAKWRQSLLHNTKVVGPEFRTWILTPVSFSEALFFSRSPMSSLSLLRCRSLFTWALPYTAYFLERCWIASSYITNLRLLPLLTRTATAISTQTRCSHLNICTTHQQSLPSTN